MRPKHLILFLSLFPLLAACTRQERLSTPVIETEATAVATPVSATLPAENATATPVATLDEADSRETPSAKVTVTPTLSPIRATQQALADAVRVPTRAATVEPIASDDYVALTDQACLIVEENYVRDDFNGVDWAQVCMQYRDRAAGIDDQQAFWDLMGELIAELDDRHSRFVPPTRFALEFGLPTEGAGRPWPGFMVRRAREDERLLVWDVCATGPAARAGLQRGDVVVAIDGQEIGEHPQDVDVNALLYAGDKAEVQLTVRQGPGVELRQLTIPYGGASGCDGWRYGMLTEAPRIGYIRIAKFSGDAATNIADAIEQLEEEGALEGLVLDVRHNPGGNADEAIAIFTTGTFGLTGPLRQDASQGIYRIRGPVRWNETTPVALLIDGASASAAEYFATAMKQSGRATLVGMPTAGNTEGITSFNLADGSVIRLAVTTLQLPDGSTLEGVGVQPDVRVSLGEWGLREMPDVQLQAAYGVLAGE